jgi:hypothetical protein
VPTKNNEKRDIFEFIKIGFYQIQKPTKQFLVKKLFYKGVTPNCRKR